MKQYTVAVLGATGAVGQEMIKILQERNFPVGKLVPLASARSAGKTVTFRGEEVAIQEACDTAFEGVDIVLGAAENDIAKRFAPAIVKAGAVFVDNSSAFRLDPKVPLIVPEINPEDVSWHSGIIANPNCSTIITITTAHALYAMAPLRPPTAPPQPARAPAVPAGRRGRKTAPSLPSGLPRSSQLAAGFVLPSLLLRGRWGCSGRAILHCRRLSAALLQKGGQERKGLEEGETWALSPL